MSKKSELEQWRSWNLRVRRSSLYWLWVALAALQIPLAIWLPNGGPASNLPSPFNGDVFWYVDATIIVLILIAHFLTVRGSKE
jgi:hypothetical protein